MSTLEAVITTGLENVNLPLPVPVKLPPILMFPPFVLKVMAELNVWLLDKVIALVVAEPNVTPVNPGWR